jgi:hypothetical protein
LAEFSWRAGLEGINEVDVLRSLVIDWREGGPDEWAAPLTARCAIS